jgi:hypothetical protein
MTRVNFSTADMSQLRSLLALQQFMRACGEAVEESEAVSLFNTLRSVSFKSFCGGESKIAM